jgi:hypothetical protein
MKENKNLVKLSSYNPAYPAKEFRRDQVLWIFTVKYINQKVKREAGSRI